VILKPLDVARALVRGKNVFIDLKNRNLGMLEILLF
jgi:hypothetical protein